MFKFKNHSIRFSLAAVIILLTVILCIGTSVISTHFITKTLINKNFSEYTRNMSNTIENGINEITYQISMHSIVISSDESLYSVLTDRTGTVYEKQADVQKIIGNILKDCSDIAAVSLITEYGDFLYYTSDESLEIIPNFDMAKKISGSNLTITDEIFTSGSEKYIVFGKQFSNMNKNYNIGSMFFYINSNLFEKTYLDLMLKDSRTIILSDGNIILSNNKEEIGSKLFIGGIVNLPDNQIVYAPDKNTILLSMPLANIKFSDKLSLVTATPYSAIYDTVRQYINIILAVIVLLGLVSTVLIILFANKLVKYLSVLTRKMRNFNIKTESESVIPFKNEISVLENSYNRLTDEIKELIAKNNEEKEKQRAIELKALHSQINAHFIYNTLDTISWMAKIKHQPEIEQLTQAVAQFFRISLHKGDTFITVREELKHVQSYVTVEQVRMPGKFEIFYDISDDILDIKIIKIILQPIVENAIKHGFARKKKGGIINIRGFLSGGFLVFEIKDNGKGVDINNMIDNTFAFVNFQSGYGITSINERLRLQYGDESRLSFKSKENHGTLVTIKIKLANL